MDLFLDSNDSKSAGRWTPEEHSMFLEGLRMYNKQWKLIAELVKTRTVVQIRTHAQKYFQKLEKVRMTNVSTPLGSETEASPSFMNSKSGTRADSITSADGYEFSVRSHAWTEDSDSEKGGQSLLDKSSHSGMKSPRRESKKRTRDEKHGRFRSGKRLNSDVRLECKSESVDPLLDFMPLDEMADTELDRNVLLFLDDVERKFTGAELSLQWETLTPASFFDEVESTHHCLTPLSHDSRAAFSENVEIGLNRSFRANGFDREKSFFTSHLGELCNNNVRHCDSVDDGSFCSNIDHEVDSLSAPRKRGRPRKMPTIDTEQIFLCSDFSLETSSGSA